MYIEVTGLIKINGIKNKFDSKYDFYNDIEPGDTIKVTSRLTHYGNHVDMLNLDKGNKFSDHVGNVYKMLQRNFDYDNIEIKI